MHSTVSGQPLKQSASNWEHVEQLDVNNMFVHPLNFLNVHHNYLLRKSHTVIIALCDKTDQNVTPGLFHCIGPTDSYTYILHIHSVIAMLSLLVCFPRTSLQTILSLN